jgi:uncharacterized membrane protein YqaE (UPF0057 family)
MILLAIILPPVAVLMCGKPFQALLNCFLTLFLWVPGVIHAILVVNARNADRRQAELLAAQAAQTAALIAAAQAANGMPTPPTPPVAPVLEGTEYESP